MKKILILLLVLMFVSVGNSFVFGEGMSAIQRISYYVEGIPFYMRLAPAAKFPGISDSEINLVENDFWIAETPVTYELWYAIRIWAEANGYVFKNLGQEGSLGVTGDSPSNIGQQPVIVLSWYDCILWCNALSECFGYNPVYTYQGMVIRRADGIQSSQVVAEASNGFRLPTSAEWELAARYIGPEKPQIEPLHSEVDFMDGIYWTPRDYASGATADNNDYSATQKVAWYSRNSRGKTHDVAKKQSNALGLYDMNGLVWEWCFTNWWGKHAALGGSIYYSRSYITTGFFSSYQPSFAGPSLSFRFVKTEL